MGIKAARSRVALFVVILLFLGLQLLLSAPAPVGADDPPGWTVQYEDEVIRILDVSAGDAQTCWAVGVDPTAAGTTPETSWDVILKTGDGGATWEEQDAGVIFYPLAVDAVDAQTCWMAGVIPDMEFQTIKGAILRTVDGGDNWEVVISIAGYGPRDLSAVDTQTCWVVGSNQDQNINNYIAKTTDGGKNWSLLKDGITTPLNSVSAVDADTCWVAGGVIYSDGFNPYGNTVGTLLKTSNGGIDWIEQGEHNCAYFDVSAVDDLNVWAYGVHIESSNFYFLGTQRSNDGGFNWSKGLAPLSMYGLAKLDAVDATTAWLVGFDQWMGGFAAKTVNGGTTWSIQTTITGTQYLLGITAVGADNAWASGYDPSLSVNGGLILHTSDGGYASPAPVISTIAPASGLAGDEVTISGSNFGATPTPISGGWPSQVAFGSATVASDDIVSWSDTEIVCRVPEGLALGPTAVTVTTPGGTSNAVSFNVGNVIPPEITSITPNQAMQFTWQLDIGDLAGNGFQPGATVRLEKGGLVIEAVNVNVVSDTSITCSFMLFGAEPGVYDVVVSNPDGLEARLSDGFTVTSACGQGGGAAVLMLGIALGFLSLAGYGDVRKRRGRK